MAVLHKPEDQYRLAAMCTAIGSHATPEILSLHTSFNPVDIADTLSNPVFKDRCSAMEQGRYAIWNQVLTESGVDIGRFLHSLAPGAVMAIERALQSADARERMAAAKMILDYDPLLQRPTVVHELNYRFSQDDLDKARAIARALASPTVTAERDAAPSSIN